MELVALLQKQGVVENVKAVIEKIVASALPALINQNLEVRCTPAETNKNFFQFGSIIDKKKFYNNLQVRIPKSKHASIECAHGKTPLERESNLAQPLLLPHQ